MILESYFAFGYLGTMTGLSGCSKMFVRVILNEVKDLALVDKTRFFASLRMTNKWFLDFFKFPRSSAAALLQSDRHTNYFRKLI
jgi:hypothetical protein